MQTESAAQFTVAANATPPASKEAAAIIASNREADFFTFFMYLCLS
jgi:hypothetical protein